MFLTMVKVVHSIPSVTHIADKFLITEKKNVFSPAIRFPITKASEWDWNTGASAQPDWQLYNHDKLLEPGFLWQQSNCPFLPALWPSTVLSLVSSATVKR